MLLEMLKSKLHNATVLKVELNYSGSLSIDKNLMEKANIQPYEKIDVFNMNNGNRFSTYAIPAKKGMICVNGAAARLAIPGDKLIIVSYCLLNPIEAQEHKPVILILDEKNNIVSIP